MDTLNALAELERISLEYNIGFFYTRNDDGVHLSINGQNFNLGFPEPGAATAAALHNLALSIQVNS